MEFEPDYRNIVAVASNRKAERLPFYEHHISLKVMQEAADFQIPPPKGGVEGLKAHYAGVCELWRRMGYDIVTFEGAICPVLPDHGAIMGGRPGPIQNREDFEKYPFAEIPGMFKKQWDPHFAALSVAMPEGMKAVGGCGYGVFEISEDLVGYESLCVMMYDDPELFADLYRRIGDLMVELWTHVLDDYGDMFCVCRMGDDLGFKSATLLAPETVIEHVVPQYRRIIELVHSRGKPFLLHSCGNIFPVMDAIIEAGIDAKHSNEDIIAPFTEWIDRYADRIGLFGGIDVDVVCRGTPDNVKQEVLKRGRVCMESTNGFAIGSGNSIPDYVPPQNYAALIEACRQLREEYAG